MSCAPVSCPQSWLGGCGRCRRQCCRIGGPSRQSICADHVPADMPRLPRRVKENIHPVLFPVLIVEVKPSIRTVHRTIIETRWAQILLHLRAGELISGG